MKAVETYMGEHPWDEVVYLGDLMDWDFISKHNIDNPRSKEKRRIHDEYLYASEFLDRHQRLAPKAKFTLIEGNHDYRIEAYIDKHPEEEGTLEVQTGLQLIKRKIKWVRYWSKGELHKIGHAIFIHGRYTTQYHARKHVDAYGTNVFYGHTHDVQYISKELLGDNKTIAGQSLGCLCRYDQSYMQGKPNKWQQAFGVFEFFPDGFFQYNVIRIFKHRFRADGKTYEG
jgi:hypothetical protein